MGWDVEEFKELCLELVSVHPNPLGRQAAKKWIRANVINIEQMRDIVRAAKLYKVKVDHANLSFQYIKRLDKWLPDYQDYLPVKKDSSPSLPDLSDSVTDPTKIAEYSQQLKLILK